MPVVQGGQDAPVVLTPPRPDNDELGPWLLALVLGAVLAAALVLLAMTPEPCTDNSGSTVCGATSHKEVNHGR